MSSAVDLTLVLDNRVNVSATSTKVVRISGTQNNFFEINPDGNSFGSSILFNNVVTPSLSNTLLTRNIRLRYSLTVANSAAAILGVNPTAPLNAVPFVPNQMAPRAFPLQSICDNISLVINGATTTINSRVVLSATQRILPKDWIMKESTEGPTMADNAPFLLQDGFLATTAEQCFSPSQQPLSGPYSSDGTTRGSFYPVAAAAGSTTYDISESIMVSPLSYYTEEVFLSNINTLSLQFNFSQLADAVVFSSGLAVLPAGFAVSISQPRLELTYIQVANDIVQIPRLVTYPYDNLVYFNKTFSGTDIDSAAQTSYARLQSDTLRLSSTPSKLFIFARPILTARTALQGDAFCSIGQFPTAGANFVPNLSINLGNRTGMLTSASCKTIYQMSVRNGYRGTYQDWQFGSGSLIIVDIVHDLGVSLQSGDILPGEAGSVNINVSCDFSNANYHYAQAAQNGTAYAGVPIEMVIIPVYSGIVSITPDNCLYNVGELSEAEVNALLRTAPTDGSMVSSEALKPTIQAGSLYGKKQILGHTAHGIGRHAGVMSAGVMSAGVMSGAGTRGKRAGVMTYA